TFIARIAHVKSTLADSLIQLCGGLTDREMADQVLDSMDLERERGITIKAQSVALRYKARDGETYLLNLIDTPGHVDFSYEVSRSLAACEGALLVVDAGQGVEAQSVANCYTAIEQGLEVPAGRRISEEKSFAVVDGLVRTVERMPPPKGSTENPLQALIIDSWFDSYVGVVSLVRVVNGTISKGDRLVVHSTGRRYTVDRVGVFTPRAAERESLTAGEVGYLIASIKEIDAAPVGDTIVSADARDVEPLPGFKRVRPRVFAGLFPVVLDDYDAFRQALQKLAMNDSALTCEPATSAAQGIGRRCGFIGV